MSRGKPAFRELLRSNVGDAVISAQALLESRLVDVVEEVASNIASGLRDGGKVLLCGNGGSAADAQHLAAELIGRFRLDRRPLAAISLSDNIAAVTAIGNDYGYEDVFVRGVRALGRTGDILLGLSTSGGSPNVVAALRAGNELGLLTVAIVGRPECEMASAAQMSICVQAADTARVQEGQMLLGHTIFEWVEAELCDPS